MSEDSKVAAYVVLLSGTEHIRRRPGMYIGDTGNRGLHQLAYELVYNSVDEALAGYCKNIDVKINVDGSLSVGDDGRGICVDIHPKLGISTLEAMLTISGTVGKVDKRDYKTFCSGLYGMGAMVVTALSEWTQAEVRRNGKVDVQEYGRGKALGAVQEIGVSRRTGTKITFRPDREIFHEAAFDYDTLQSCLRELAFLNKGLSIQLTDKRSGKKDKFCYPSGVVDFVEYLDHGDKTLHQPIRIEKVVDDVRVELALQYTTGQEERVRCYANNAHTTHGGTHLAGFRAGLTRTLKSYGSKRNLFPKDLQPISEDYREGLTAVLGVQLPEPQFESFAKTRLNNSEVEGIVASVVSEQLGTFLEENPKAAQKIMKRVLLGAEARVAAVRARKARKV
jgi:DNA gyrase subunit B